MRRFRALIGMCLTLLAWALIVPSAHAAAPDCSAANPSANRWAQVAGTWSDSTKWSLGHVPTDTEHACLLSSASSNNPTVDTDIDVLSIVSGNVTIPTGRTVDARFVNGTMFISAGATLRSRGGAGSELAGQLYLRGTLRVAPGTTVSALFLNNASGETSTIDADGDVSFPHHNLQGSLHLLDDTRINNGTLTVGESITGDPATSISATSLTIGNVASTSVATVELPIRAASITFRGETDLVADITSPTTTLTLNGSTTKVVTFASNVVTAAILRVASGTYSLENGSRLVASTKIDSTATKFRLKTCELDTPTASFANAVEVDDVGCIDPPSGTNRKVTVSSTLTFTQDDEFGDGGVLQLGAPRIAVSGGATIVDGATAIEPVTAMTISPSGPGTTRLERLFEGTVRGTAATNIQYLVDTGEVLVLDTPTRTLSSKHMCTDRVVATGSGRVEIHDDVPFTLGCVFGDDPGPGALPVTYFAGGVPYEPRRNFVSLNGGTWTPSGTLQAVVFGGFGTVNGSLNVEYLRPGISTLKVNGNLIAGSLDVRPADGMGVLDLTTATSHSISRVHVDQAPTATLRPPFSRVVAPGITSIPTITHAGGIETGMRLELVSATGELRLVAIATTPVPPTPTPPPQPSIPPVVTSPSPEPPAPTRETTEVVTPPAGVRLVGTGRADQLRGAHTHDTLLGGLGDDVLWGLAGNDALNGGRGNDTMYGYLGDDLLTCGGGAKDVADGGPGNDVIGCRDGGPGRDVVNCGPGKDRAVVDRRDIVRGCEVVVRR